MCMYAYTRISTSTHKHKPVWLQTFGASSMAIKKLDETKWEGKGVSALWGKLWLMQGGNISFYSCSSLEQGAVPP